MSSDWNECRLAELITIKHGFAFKGEFFTDKPTPYQLTTPGNFSMGGGFQPGKGKYYSGPIPGDYILSPGNVIVTMTDLSKAADTLGFAAFVPMTSGTTWLHNQRVGLVQVKPAAPILPRYLQYLMRSNEYRHWVVSTSTGSTVKHTSPGRICEFAFALPPLQEQDRIASILGELDDRIALLHETNTTLESIAQTLFKSWFVDFDPVRAKLEGRVPEGMDEATAALFPESFEESESELALVPGGWRVGTLQDLATLNPESWKLKAHPDAIQYIDLANTKNNNISETELFQFGDAPSRARRVLRAGDSIIGTVRPGNRSFAYIYSGANNLTGSTGFAVLRPINQKNAEFIFIAATQNSSIDHLAHVADGGAYPAVRPEVVAGIKVVLPSDAVTDAFHKIVFPIFSLVGENKIQAQTLVSLRDTLLPRLISGQLRLPEAEAIFEEATE